MQGTLTKVEAFWGARCIVFHNRDGSIQDWLHNLLTHHFFRSINLCSKLCSAEGQVCWPLLIMHFTHSLSTTWTFLQSLRYCFYINGPWSDKKCSSLLGSSEGTAACGIQQSFSSFFLKIGFSLREAPAVSESHTWESCKHYALKPIACELGKREQTWGFNSPVPRLSVFSLASDRSFDGSGGLGYLKQRTVLQPNAISSFTFKPALAGDNTNVILLK